MSPFYCKKVVTVFFLFLFKLLKSNEKYIYKRKKKMGLGRWFKKFANMVRIFRVGRIEMMVRRYRYRVRHLNQCQSLIRPNRERLNRDLMSHHRDHRQDHRQDHRPNRHRLVRRLDNHLRQQILFESCI